MKTNDKKNLEGIHINTRFPEKTVGTFRNLIKLIKLTRSVRRGPVLCD